MSKRPQWVLAPFKRKPPSRSRLARGFILLKGVGAPNWVPAQLKRVASESRQVCRLRRWLAIREASRKMAFILAFVAVGGCASSLARSISCYFKLVKFDPADQLVGSLLRRRSVSGARQSYRPDFVPALCGQGEADNLETRSALPQSRPCEQLAPCMQVSFASVATIGVSDPTSPVLPDSHPRPGPVRSRLIFTARLGSE
ncbi:hypothetical protein Micbo1qcDRAFT_213627 [Microdochium bolleyi]|uniref:Uncharacterized protein n=1 Tax=Microdochium bolleyi TaxID=196109 RepID=A0A136II52_9PEZI|nr:hypothetical protein Micbo1qcDRAFT_213627 [Microdochium bolleyi]